MKSNSVIRVKRFNFIWVLLCLLLLLVACGKASPPLDLRKNKARVAEGARLFAANCASCHGAEGQGHAQWRIKKADGNFHPPPLNGSGHTWHHKQEWLIAFVKNGSPVGTMPAWKDKLTLHQIESILAWAQSRWPEWAYKRWLDVNEGN